MSAKKKTAEAVSKSQVNSKPKKSQSQQILQYMQTHKMGITPMQALKKFGCFRLSARISDLRKDGHIIKSELVHKDGRTFARYTMEVKK